MWVSVLACAGNKTTPERIPDKKKLLIDEYYDHRKLVCCCVVQRGNRSTLTTRTVKSTPGVICMCRIRVILIAREGIDHIVYYFLLFLFITRCQVRESGEGSLKPPQSPNIGVFNVRGCSTNEVKKCEIGKTFLRRRLDVCALNETKLKGKGEVVGRVSGVQGGRAREGVALLLSGWLLRCVVELKDVSFRLMWVRVKL